MRTFALLTAFIPAAGTATALEASAGSESVGARQVGLSARLDATSAALTAAYNKMLVCNNKGMLFNTNPATTGKDADGCISTMTSQDYELYKESRSVSAPQTCYLDGRFATRPRRHERRA